MDNKKSPIKWPNCPLCNAESVLNDMAISPEKRQWLKEIGAAEFPECIKFIATYGEATLNYSVKGLIDTPLEDLKKIYEGIRQLEDKRQRYVDGKEFYFST